MKKAFNLNVTIDQDITKYSFKSEAKNKDINMIVINLLKHSEFQTMTWQHIKLGPVSLLLNY